jgi:excisionase family DNA binding protein
MPIEIANIRLYSIQELSHDLNVTSFSIRSYIKNGRLKAQKIGGRWYVAEENLHRFLKGEYYSLANN